MATIFISHSKRDEDLVTDIAKVLRNIGHTPIIEEFIPEEEKEPVPYEEIRKNVSLSQYMFLFLQIILLQLSTRITGLHLKLVLLQVQRKDCLSLNAQVFQFHILSHISQTI